MYGVSCVLLSFLFVLFVCFESCVICRVLLVVCRVLLVDHCVSFVDC